MINQLIDRYMAAEISPEEQERLRHLLMADDLPEEYVPYREMFALLDEPMEIPTDEELTAFARENGLELTERRVKRITLKPWLRYAGIAASFVLIFLAGRWSVGENPRVIVHELPETDLAQYNDLFKTETGTTIEEAFNACEEKMNEFEDHYTNSIRYEEL
ncbi:MAG: hypothetical protein IJ013_08410 [Bacteroidaceae bacterium]|nr:hypothetical protein [Bacteroidaceae bacterium]